MATQARGQCPRCRTVVSIEEGGIVAEHGRLDLVEWSEEERASDTCPGSGQPALPANAKETR